jgi:cytochrome c biogenesis protein CcdA
VNLLLTLPLAFAAGMLTIFSPCVLPLAPRR